MERKFKLLTDVERRLLKKVGLPVWESKMDETSFGDPDHQVMARDAIERVCRPLVSEHEIIDQAVCLGHFEEILKALRSLSGIAFSEKLRESL